jgi:hypothetical protein
MLGTAVISLQGITLFLLWRLTLITFGFWFRTAVHIYTVGEQNMQTDVHFGKSTAPCHLRLPASPCMYLSLVGSGKGTSCVPWLCEEECM